jgi:hypothetical protein
MPWVRLDDGFPDHWKLAELGDLTPIAGWLYICGLAYCNRQLTDGRIPKHHIGRLADLRGIACGVDYPDYPTQYEPITAEDVAAHLVRVGLWEDDGANYRIHDYLDYQPSREETLALRETRAEVGRRGGLAKAKQFASKLPSKASSKASSKTEAKVCPVPVPVPSTRSNTKSEDQDHGREADASLHERGTIEPEGFSAFWAAYPRKTAKQDAARAYAKLKPDAALLSVILAAISAQQGWRPWREGFIPHPATWLNAQRWTDEAPPDVVNGHAPISPAQARAARTHSAFAIAAQAIAARTS